MNFACLRMRLNPEEEMLTSSRKGEEKIFDVAWGLESSSNKSLGDGLVSQEDYQGA